MDHANCRGLDYWAEGFVKVNVGLLKITFGNEASFSSLNGAVNKSFGLKDPLASHSFGCMRCDNKRPRLICQECIEFSCHCFMPLWVFLYSYKTGGSLWKRVNGKDIGTGKSPSDSAICGLSGLRCVGA